MKWNCSGDCIATRNTAYSGKYLRRSNISWALAIYLPVLRAPARDRLRGPRGIRAPQEPRTSNEGCSGERRPAPAAERRVQVVDGLRVVCAMNAVMPENVGRGPVPRNWILAAEGLSLLVAALDTGRSLFLSHQDPAMVEQFLVWEKTI